MNATEFKIYTNQRIKAFREAYADDPDQNSSDPLIRELWQECRENWNSHADTVLNYANEEYIAGLMDYWREIIRENKYNNSHEGIGLNIGLTTENINEILTTSVDDENMYWITEHLKNHPNYHK